MDCFALETQICERTFRLLGGVIPFMATSDPHLLVKAFDRASAARPFEG